MTSRSIEELARSLDSAWARATTVPAPSRLHPGLTVDDAYAVQDLIIAARLEAGRKIAGWKLGLTSAPPPSTPIVGTLLDDMVIPSGARLEGSTMVGPMVEGEIIVEIGETLTAPATVEALASGAHRIAGGIEVIDYRTVDSTGAVDWVSDNSTVAYAVVGQSVPVAEVDPAALEVVLSRDNDEVGSGRGDLVMGNPLAAVAWLSNHLLERGRTLSAGEIVLTGSLTGHHQVPETPALFSADFGHLGTVTVGFDV